MEHITDIDFDPKFDPKPALVYEKDVHTEHCCQVHKRCKYGDDNCTVTTGAKPSSIPCNCDWM